MNSTENKTIAKLQHFYEVLVARKCQSESSALTDIGDVRCTYQAQVRVYDELLAEFNKMFDNFLYSE